MKKDLAAAAALLGIVVAGAGLMPRASLAAGTDELWEVSTQMNIPGMPAGMGAMAQQVCRGTDPKQEFASRKDMQDCTITDMKQSPTRVTMTATCKGERKVTVDYNYNAGRTEYKGTIRMVDGGKEMLMNTSGRKIGTCDAQEAKRGQDAQVARIQAESANAKAQGEEILRRSEAEQIQACNGAVEKMDFSGLGMYGRCTNKNDDTCRQLMSGYQKQYPKIAAACNAKTAEFCRLYQTRDGFMKMRADRSKQSGAAETCGVPAETVRASLCADAGKTDAYEFIGGNCPDLARPLAKDHCAGRSYTVSEGDPRRVEAKWFKFCTAVAGNFGGDETAQAAPSAAQSVGQKATDTINTITNAIKPGEAINEGINKLKGLFGR